MHADTRPLAHTHTHTHTRLFSHTDDWLAGWLNGRRLVVYSARTQTLDSVSFRKQHTPPRIIDVHRCLPQFTVNVQIESFSYVVHPHTNRVYCSECELKIISGEILFPFLFLFFVLISLEQNSVRKFPICSSPSSKTLCTKSQTIIDSNLI